MVDIGDTVNRIAGDVEPRTHLRQAGNLCGGRRRLGRLVRPEEVQGMAGLRVSSAAQRQVIES